MQNKKIRWAILGAGRIAHFFAKDFKEVKNAELVAVAARDLSRAKEFAGLYNIPHTFSYEELYTSDKIDAVYIATPHNFHYEQSLACLQNGKAVLCEKPITINDKEFKQLAALSKQKQVFLMEAMWTYFLSAIQKAKEWIAEGKIGTIKLIQADFCYRMEYDPLGRLLNPFLAGGALLDLGVYPIAFTSYFMNRPTESIRASGIIGSTKVDESTGMVLQYGDASAFLFTSILTTTLNKGFIFGEKGHIEIPDFYKARTAYLYDAEKKLIGSFEDGRTTAGYDYETQEATDRILQGMIESEVVPHSRSNELQEIMTEVRRQIGLKYPFE